MRAGRWVCHNAKSNAENYTSFLSPPLGPPGPDVGLPFPPSWLLLCPWLRLWTRLRKRLPPLPPSSMAKGPTSRTSCPSTQPSCRTPGPPQARTASRSPSAAPSRRLFPHPSTTCSPPSSVQPWRGSTPSNSPLPRPRPLPSAPQTVSPYILQNQPRQGQMSRGVQARAPIGVRCPQNGAESECRWGGVKWAFVVGEPGCRRQALVSRVKCAGLLFGSGARC